MIFRIQQGLVVVLSVYVCYLLAQHAEMTKSDYLIVDFAEIPAGGRYLPCYDIFCPFVVCDHLDRGFFPPGTNKSSVRPAAQGKTYCFYHYRFSRAGLTCYYIETVVEIYICFFDYREISYADMFYHFYLS